MKLTAAAAALIVAACATPYQSSGLSGGYIDHNLGNGLRSVEFIGNGFTSSGTAVEYAYRRAGEVCGTPGFEEVGGNTTSQNSLLVGNNYVTEVNKPRATLMFRCKTAVAIAPVAAAPIPTASRRCDSFNTGLASLKMATGTVPDGSTEEDAVDAALQFATTMGVAVAAKDYRAHTVMSQRFVGQTRMGNCGINEYFAYELRIAVAGKAFMVSMGCWHSVGWEAHATPGGLWMPANRGEQQLCVDDGIPSNDAKIPSMFIDGMILLMQARHPAPPPQPHLAPPLARSSCATGQLAACAPMHEHVAMNAWQRPQ